MPEILEVEQYRRQAEAVVGRRVVAVDAPDTWYLKGVDPATLDSALRGRKVVGVRRKGKLLLIDADGAVLGLRFGMTGRLALDGGAPEFALEYAPALDDPRWDRFALSFRDGGRLRMQDPRRLGAVVLDPDESALGPDAMTITPSEFEQALAGTSAAVKAVLLDQARVAGIGNMIADEVLWHARLDPARAANALDAGEVVALHRALRRRLSVMARRGGSHRGDLSADLRVRGAACPRCGTELARRTVGGRTTYSCPLEQR